MTNTTKIRESFIFYKSFFDAIKNLENEKKTEIYDAIFFYSFDGIEPNLTGISASIFTLIRPQLDANRKRFENGCKEKTKSKTEAKPKQKESKVEANKNLNPNLNHNLNLKNQFEEFWKLYDKKEGRKDCEKKFELALKKDPFEKIMMGLQSYVKARSTDKKFWKLPETWLNKECWNDEYSEASVKPNSLSEKLNSIAGNFLFKSVDTSYDKVLLRCIDIDHKNLAIQLPEDVRGKIKAEILSKYPNKTLEVTY